MANVGVIVGNHFLSVYSSIVLLILSLVYGRVVAESRAAVDKDTWTSFPAQRDLNKDDTKLKLEVHDIDYSTYEFELMPTQQLNASYAYSALTILGISILVCCIVALCFDCFSHEARLRRAYESLTNDESAPLQRPSGVSFLVNLLRKTPGSNPTDCDHSYGATASAADGNPEASSGIRIFSRVKVPKHRSGTSLMSSQSVSLSKITEETESTGNGSRSGSHPGEDHEHDLRQQVGDQFQGQIQHAGQQAGQPQQYAAKTIPRDIIIIAPTSKTPSVMVTMSTPVADTAVFPSTMSNEKGMKSDSPGQTGRLSPPQVQVQDPGASHLHGDHIV